MATDVLELADRLWRGEERIEDHHPVGFSSDLTEVAPGAAFLPSLGNVSAFETAEGLVLVDTGNFVFAQGVHDAIRDWSDAPLHTAIYTHGHVDHVFGVPTFEIEEGAPRARVVAHETVNARFDRYARTAGWNGKINARQFGVESIDWPTEFRRPDETYRDELVLEVGGERFELRHARGETDDATWVWLPGRRILCCGDLFIWATPNAGNPQKVQRYPDDWARALRDMAALGAELMLPGHGVPVAGADRVRSALEDTALLLESIVDQTLELMNRGAALDEVLHAVRAPEELLDRPYLRPVYDEPEFIVRNVWRLYGGWWDGNPARLKPAPDAAVAKELAGLAGGAGALAERARELAGEGDLRLAAHLAEAAAIAAPGDDDVGSIRAEIYSRRAGEEPSTMARGVFGWAARTPVAPTDPI
jgi:alkyl sulfatase BDS1-like metallo-beta-lactamase superfamily hydrolase